MPRPVPLLLIIAGSAAAADPLAGLSLYASFDQGPTPEFAGGSRSAECRWEGAPGRVGGAWRNQGGGWRIPTPLNLDLGRGTAAFWLRPDSDLAGTLGKQPRPTLLAAMNHQLIAYPDTWFFMTGAPAPGRDFAWDYGLRLPLASFPRGTWTAVALTWDAASGEKAVYRDGRLLARTRTELMRRGPGGSPLELGRAFPGDFDELLVWDRALSADEVAAVAADPAGIATRAKAIPCAVEEPWLVEPQVRTRAPGETLVAPGATVSLRVPLANRSGAPQRGSLSLTLLDLGEQPAGPAQEFPIDLPAGGSTEVPAAFTCPRLGVFKLRATVAIGASRRSRDVASVGCLPPGTPPAHPFLGCHVGQESGLPAFGRRLGFSANRAHDMTQFTWWTRLEPEPGQWNQRLRTAPAVMDGLGYTQLGTWMTTPYWAATQKDGSRPARHDGYPPGWVPSDRAALGAYVRTTLEWFPAITTWEIWNEPNVAQFWYGTPQEYARLCQEVYTEAKRVRPDLTVYVQFDAHGRWFHQAAEAGLLRWCDGVSYHAYASPGDHPQAGARGAAAVRAALAAHGRPDLPIINSEGGMTTTSFLRGIDHPRLLPESKRTYTWLAAAERLVQWRVVQMAAGVRAHFYYHLSPAGIDRDTGSGWSPVDVGGGPTPAAVAHGQFAWQLGGGSFARILAADPGLRCYLFQRPDASTCAVLWAEDGAGFRLTTAGQAFDLMGNPLAVDGLGIGTSPVYLRLPGDAAQAASALAAASLTTVTPPSVATVAAMDPFPVANELGPARLHPLDLGALANLGLADSPGAGRLVPGRHTWLGVPVAIGTGERALLALKPGATAAPLAVGSAVRGLFLCQAVDRAAGAAANWQVTYADGTVSDLTLGARELGAWDQDHQAGEDSRTVPLTGEGQPPRFLRLWYWENPRAQVPVTSLTVGNRSHEATLVVAGVTVATWQ